MRAEILATRYLSAKIQLAPRYTDLYLKIFLKKIDGIVDTFRDLESFIKRHPDSEDFTGFFNAISKRNFDEDSFWWLKRLNKEEGFSSIRFSLKHPHLLDRKILSYIEDEIKGTRNEIQHGLERLKSIDPNKIRKEYEEYKANVPRELAIRLLQIPTLVKQFEFWLKDAEEKIGELLRSTRSRIEEPDSYRPKAEKIEILYHTSVNSKTIFHTGFSHRIPKVEGIGGSTETKSGKQAISFTSDFHVAKEIMRCLKEAILITRGFLKRNHLLDWARRENILPNVLQGYRTLSHGGEPETPLNVFQLYRAYLTFSKRYNPMFYGNMEPLIRILTTKSPRDVGILVCQVDMTNPDIDYLASMREYRVPSIAVRKILKVIS